ncbi:MAG: glycosyltransferase family A protein [Thermomicrobiales bacterium]
MVALTIGMATYDDFDGVYFTIQSLRLYQDLSDTEILVIDNYGCDDTEKFVKGLANVRYLRATELVGTAVRELVFTHAEGDAVLCVDSHVLLVPGAIARLRQHYANNPDTRDLLQGPLLYDDLSSISTHFQPEWRSQMWGTWGTDPRGIDVDGEAFDIPSQGLGIFSCRREAWPGFNPAFRGFGGEEGYIHEKFRQRGGRTLCLPWLRWVHRFGRPKGVPYPLTVEMKLRNYIIGFTELGLDTTGAEEHFAEFLPPGRVTKVKAEALADYVTYNLPLISCVCPTYGRPPGQQHLIEEAIQSFLLQDYPNKELIVLNDCPGQELVCDAPGVRVVNVSERFPSLGDKRNAGVALARGDLIATWDDDDISLPWRLSLSYQMLGQADYFNPKRGWFRHNGVLVGDQKPVVGANMSLFRRDALRTIGGYPSLTLGEDQVFDQAMRATVQTRGGDASGDPELPRDDWFYIYRWGESDFHLSGSPDANFWDEVGKRPVKPGRYRLEPHWRVDYIAEVEASLSRLIRVAVLGDTGESSGQRAPFARDDRRLRESAARHLARVRAQVAASMSDGITHLLIPRDQADWLGDHPHLEEYFSQEHRFLEAGQELGLVFALCRPVMTDTPTR